MIRYKKPDKKNALSIVAAAEREMKFTLSLKTTNGSESTIVRNIYECFRMLGDALLVLEGIKSEDHLLPIKRLTEIKINTERPISLVDNLRRLRHRINYYGYKPKLIEVEDALSMVKTIFKPLLDEIKKILEDES